VGGRDRGRWRRAPPLSASPASRRSVLFDAWLGTAAFFSSRLSRRGERFVPSVPGEGGRHRSIRTNR